SHVLNVVGAQAVQRVAERAAHGQADGAVAAMLKLLKGMTEARLATIALDLVGADAVVDGDLDTGVDFLMRQTRALAGGSNEMQRNLIAERLLGMPREHAPDAGVPFGQVAAGRSTTDGRRS
ncbi:MAG: acyl-CoA dehydrogenase, partial [Acidimicrobiia bacterium]|nr:acyl-CoA dehydrogenase [Acidimicrobiia bacterium]